MFQCFGQLTLHFAGLHSLQPFRWRTEQNTCIVIEREEASSQLEGERRGVHISEVSMSEAAEMEPLIASKRSEGGSGGEDVQRNWFAGSEGAGSRRAPILIVAVIVAAGVIDGCTRAVSWLLSCAMRVCYPASMPS